MRKSQAPNLEAIKLAGSEVALLDVARLVDTLDPIALASLTARYSNGRVLQPYRTGFETEHA